MRRHGLIPAQCGHQARQSGVGDDVLGSAAWACATMEVTRGSPNAAPRLIEATAATSRCDHPCKRNTCSHVMFAPQRARAIARRMASRSYMSLTFRRARSASSADVVRCTECGRAWPLGTRRTGGRGAATLMPAQPPATSSLFLRDACSLPCSRWPRRRTASVLLTVCSASGSSTARSGQARLIVQICESTPRPVHCQPRPMPPKSL